MVTTSMKPSVIVWDLETVPDLAGFAAANDLIGESDVEVREAMAGPFPVRALGSIPMLKAPTADPPTLRDRARQDTIQV